MSEDRYLNADEARQVREFTENYRANPPEWADPVLDELDLLISKSEGIPTLENTKQFAAIRNREAQGRVAKGAPPPLKVRASIAADDALADLDDALRQHVTDQRPLSGGKGEEGFIQADDVLSPRAEARRAQEAAARDARRGKEVQATVDLFNGRGRRVARPRDRFNGRE